MSHGPYKSWQLPYINIIYIVCVEPSLITLGFWCPEHGRSISTTCNGYGIWKTCEENLLQNPSRCIHIRCLGSHWMHLNWWHGSRCWPLEVPFALATTTYWLCSWHWYISSGYALEMHSMFESWHGSTYHGRNAEPLDFHYLMHWHLWWEVCNLQANGLDSITAFSRMFCGCRVPSSCFSVIVICSESLLKFLYKNCWVYVYTPTSINIILDYLFKQGQGFIF